MAKNKRSKILAMALCAGVMAGIYASPVMAANVNANFDDDSGNIVFTISGDTYTINKDDITKAIERNHIHSNGRISANAGFIANGGSYYAIRGTNNQYTMLANEKYFALGSGGLLKGPEGSDNYNTTKERATFYVDNATGDVTTKGTLSVADGDFKVDENGAVTAAVGSNIAGVQFNRGAIDFNNAQLRNIARVTSQEYISGHSKFEDGQLTLGREENQVLTAAKLGVINDVIQEDGSVVSKGDVKSNLNGKEYSLNQVGHNTEGITNTSNSKNAETTIQGTLKVKDNGSFQNADGSFRVNANGEIQAAGGKFYVDKYGNVKNVGTVDGVDVSELENKFYTANTNVAGIKRNAEGTETTIEGKTIIRADGSFTTAGGAFHVDTEGNIFAGNINGYNVAEIGSTVEQIAPNVAGIERAGETTTIEQDFSVNGVNNTFGSANGSFTVNTADGSFIAANGNFVVSTDGAVNTTGIIKADDFTSSGGYTLNKVGDQLSQLDSNLGTTTANVAGIKRTGETTTIEETFAVNGINDTFGSANGKFTVNTADGSFIAANGNFIVDGSGTVYSEKAVIAGGAVTLENGQGSTSIKGGAITAQTLNGKDINSLVTSDDMEHELKNVGGIIRDAEKGAAPGEGTTTIEGVLSVNGQDKQISMFGGNGPVFEFDSTDNSTDVYGRMNFVNGSDVSFGYNSKLTGAFTSTNFEDLANKLDDVYNRTQGISYDEATGSTTISDKIGTADGAFESGNSITVGNDGITMNGDTVMNGDSTTGNQGGSGDGSVTNPDSDHIVNGGQEVNNGQTVNGGQVVNGGQTVNGDAQFNDQVTVGDTDGNQTVINGGDLTVDNSVTVGSGENQTIVNNDGVTVGGADGTSINHDEVRVGGEGGSYMNDTDVVSGEGVSLNQTAERVGHLENRVGELEDRIDKVGAMAAAIANLRTMGYDPAAPTEVAVGIGQYRDETGAALGLFHYPNRDFMLSLSVSTSGDEVMGGIGATWKFGRKSPEKVAEIKKAQAEADARRAEEAKLAKAEEMKQAAKEAKIKAQQERHAKLAAERAAQAEAAK